MKFKRIKKLHFIGIGGTGMCAELAVGLREAGAVWMERFRRGEAIALDPLHTKILTHLKGGIPCPRRCLLAGQEWARCG